MLRTTYKESHRMLNIGRTKKYSLYLQISGIIIIFAAKSLGNE